MKQISMLLDSVKLYYNQIKDIPLLTKEEEEKLGFLILGGDKEAVEKLIYHNLRLAFFLAMKMEYHASTSLDWIQEANIGLIKAAHNYDVTKKYRFRSYAAQTIRCSLLLNRRDYESLIRLPRNAYDLQKKLKKESHLLEYELGRKPTIEELASRLSVSKKAIETLQKSIVSIDSIEQLFLETDVNENLLIDRVETPEEQVVKEMFPKDFCHFLEEELSERENGILHLKYGLEDGVEHTFEEIGTIYGIKRSRVCHIEKAVRNKIKVKAQKYF